MSELAPLLDALAEAADLPPVEASRLLRRAVASHLGWRARLVPSPSPLASEGHALLEDGVALIPVAPGAGALRLSGGTPAALRRVAELCVQAFDRARTHLHGTGRRMADGEPRRVLLVGRDPALRAALVALLGPGFAPVEVEGGAAAAEAGRCGPLDAAMFDLAGDAEGLDALEALRAEAAGAELPAIVLGARADEPSRLRALGLGADFVSPPYSAQELRVRLEHAIRRARSTRALRDEALTDPLTGLPNRRALEDRLHEELRRARRYGAALSCIMGDVDLLKAINDTLGHACGDQALQGMAAVLQGELRASDIAARVGGDEFLLILPHTGAVEALALAERIRRRLAALRIGHGDAIRPLSASFGVSQLGPEGDGQGMVDAADQALYEAKRAGRGKVVLAQASARAGQAATRGLPPHATR